MAEDRTTPWVALPPGEHLDWEEGAGPCPTPWMARVTWRFEDGKATPVGVEMRSADGQPVTALAWRAVPVARLLDVTRKFARGWAIGVGVLAHFREDEPALAKALVMERALEPPRKRGRPRFYSDEHYEQVARAYNAAYDASDKHPVEAVRKEFGRTDRSDTAPKAWVREARKRGLITERKDDRGK